MTLVADCEVSFELSAEFFLFLRDSLMHTRLALNFRSSCYHTECWDYGVCHHIWLKGCWGWKAGFLHARQALYTEGCSFIYNLKIMQYPYILSN